MASSSIISPLATFVIIAPGGKYSKVSLKNKFSSTPMPKIQIVDMKKEQKVNSFLFGGFSDYLVYDGWNLKGWPVKTIVRGEIISEDFQVVGSRGFGKLVPRTLN